MKTLIIPGSRSLAPPREWDQDLDGSFGDLAVIDHIDVPSGQNFMYSFYKPTKEDISAFMMGGVIRLGIMGTAHPVINLSVFGPLITDDLTASEGFDMGPVIEKDI